MKNENNDYITQKQVNHLCLCTGYDGVGRGLKQVFPNLRSIAYVEIEAFAIANLVSKMEEGQMDEAPIFTDVKTFPYRKFRGCVDILSAGFPCQPFSSAGSRKGVEDPRHIYPYISEGIALCRPRYVLLENVEGIVSSKTADGESVLLYVLRDLERRGYSCSWGTFSAAEVGAPHLRKRIFILAKLGDSKDSGREGGNLGQKEGQLRGAGSSATQLGNTKHDGSFTGGYIKDEQGGRHKEVEAMQFERPSYPSRYGEEQRDWEEPRVVSYREVQTQPKLGGAVDGVACGIDPTANRVDRLRLLGNGVVPDTCALAVRTLFKQLN